MRADEIAAARDAESGYRQSLARVNELLRHGGTLSGHEPNCAFLNTAGGPFANVSAITGFDFPDDGRGLALVDWDGDGDVDVWTSNRTGPRLRFLRNDTPRSDESHFVSFQLEGRRCNRDAIAARVRVTHPAAPTGGLIKSLRAGEGFLSQSSKRLHFGLGRQQSIERVTVHWPDGTQDDFRDLVADRHYHIVQGESSVKTWHRDQLHLAIQPSPAEPLPPTDRARVVLTQRLPLPRLPGLPESQTGPVLVNLWASWCGPCLEELHQFSAQADRLKEAQLELIAFNVDQVAGETASATTDPDQLLASLNFPFVSARAGAPLIEQLHFLLQVPFDPHVELSIPTSLLVDRQRRLAVIYRGPVEIDQLLADVRDLSLPDARWAEQSLPLAGRWNEPPRPQMATLVARDLLNRRLTDDAREYVTHYTDLLSGDPEYGRLLVWLGDELLASGQTEPALEQYRAALTTDPKNVAAMNNLAWQLATHPDPAVRNAQQAVHWAQQATRLTEARDPGVLDTLAASYAEAGRFDDAVKAARRALRLAEDPEQKAFAARLQQRLTDYEDQRPYRSTAASP